MEDVYMTATHDFPMIKAQLEAILRENDFGLKSKGDKIK
jgi:hypothetical protein